MQDDSLELRVATEQDIPELAALWTESFAGPRSVDDRVRELGEGMPYGTLRDCRVLEVGGRTAAALRTYRMELHFRGRRQPTLGLAGVAVAADFRRRGLGRRICVDALREGRRRGDVLSLLYPFRVSFYANLGYTLAGTLHHHRFRPGDLPLYPGWERVVRGEEADHAEVRAFYRSVAERSNGMLERDRSAWRARLPPRSRLYLHHSEDGRPDGYLVVRSSLGRERPTLHVQELVWDGDDAYRALLGWLSAQRDQFAYVTHDALPSEAFHRHLPHPRLEGSRRPRPLWFESARILRGPMLRLLDVGALQEPGTDGEVAVWDEEIPENQGRWRGGERVGTEPASSPDPLEIEEAARAFLDGSLPGQQSPPEGWSPAGGLGDFRLLDEF